jgi:hypothetical protein
MSTLIKTCKKCGKNMTVKPGKWGKFWACTGFPYCKSTEKFIFVKEEINVNSQDDNYSPSIQQTKILEVVKTELNNILCEAGPGCGKSSTLKMISKILNDYIAIAFNSKAVKSLLEKGINAITLNSLSLKISKFVFPHSKIDLDKIKKIILTCGLIAEDDRRKMIKPLTGLIGLLDANLLDYNEDNVKGILDNSNLGIEFTPDLLTLINYVNEERVNLRPVSLDFDDTLRISIQYKNHATQYKNILVDESQDLSKLNLEFIKVISGNGRLVFVGDKNQSVYAFRGADKNSLENIKEYFNPVCLPLSVTYRIPQNIVNNVLNVIFPNIQLTSEKSGGEFINGLSENLVNESLIKDESAYIICRNNSPLIKPAYELIRMGYNVTILGKNIAEDMINLIVKVKNNKDNQITDLNELSSALDSHYNKIAEKYINAKDKTWIENLRDMINTINEILNQAESIDDLLLKIDSLFSDTPANYTFMTGHKSKGLEHNNIYILKSELIGKNAKTEDEKIQEQNLLWVVLSRSLNKLVIIGESLAV